MENVENKKWVGELKLSKNFIWWEKKRWSMQYGIIILLFGQVVILVKLKVIF